MRRQTILGFIFGKPHAKKNTLKFGCTWADNIEMERRKGCEDVD
jgi:hypothetical protein